MNNVKNLPQAEADIFKLYNIVKPLYEEYDRYSRSINFGLSATAASPEDGIFKLLENKDSILKTIARLQKQGTEEKSFNPLLMKYTLQIRKGVQESIDTLINNPPCTQTRVSDDFLSLLKEKSEELGISNIGFCRITPDMIFKNKKILYPFAIVCIMEMQKEMVDVSLDIRVEIETRRVYAGLGAALNQLAGWLRSQGIPAQASHPYRGHVLFPLLGAGANLGFRGQNGLLVTPHYGIRQRIGAIFTTIENLPITEKIDFRCFSDFCAQCNLCRKKCPGKAILTQPLKAAGNTVTCIDSVKCYPYSFFGCSSCINVCPFSNGAYNKIFNRMKNNSAI